MLVQILVDNPNSWIVPYAKKLVTLIEKEVQFNSVLIFEHESVIKGEILCLLSCEKVFKDLDLNKHTLVVHESNLPKGKGWSPLTWQILEGLNSIPITLFEATESIDAGEIYCKEYINFEGTELIEEIKHKQGEKTIDLILRFLNDYPLIEGVDQLGESTFYKRRTKKDSELDIDKSIQDQFNLLRICDNERYPAFFKIKGKTYILKIYQNSSFD